MRAIEKEIVKIVYETIDLQIEQEQIEADLSIKELGITSLETVSLLFEFQEAFEITIETEEIFALRTIRELGNFLNAKMMERKSANS